MKKNKNLVVHKPNQLIEIEGGYLTTLKYSVYNFLLHKLQNEKTNHMNISGIEIFNSLEISKNYDDIIEYLDSLQKIRVISKDIKGKLWGAFNLLSAFKKNDDGTFFIEIPHLIYHSLCNDKNSLYYTTIKLLEQKSFNCTYTGIFYEILKKYEKVNIPSYLLEDLRKITGTCAKYLEYKDFKRYVIQKSLGEINKVDTKYHYTFEEKKLGRRVNEIQFIRQEKKNLDTNNDNFFLSTKLLTTIKKAKKSIYINKVFSQSTINKLLKKYDEELIIKALKECAKYNQEIKSFPALITAKIEDILNSSNYVINKKLKKLEKNSNNYETIELEKIDIIEELKKLDEYEQLKLEEKALNCFIIKEKTTFEFMLKIKETNSNFYWNLLKKYITF